MALQSLTRFLPASTQVQWRALDEIDAGACDGAPASPTLVSTSLAI